HAVEHGRPPGSRPLQLSVEPREARTRAMTFLAPVFLAGLAALAIPLLVHLIQRERKRVVEFPSLMFLRRIPYQSVRRRRIRNWLLLALRRSEERRVGKEG